MSIYHYKAVNETGKTLSGTLEALSLDHANELLSAKALTPVSLRDSAGRSGHPPGGLHLGFHPVHPEELILFTKQLSTMLRAGIPILRVVDILENQAENPRLKSVCNHIAADIRGGSNFYRALRKHPDVFSPLYCSMVLAGETSGALPQILQRLIYVISHEYKVKSDIRSVLQYPIIVLVTLVTAFILLITFVIPRFAVVYTRAEIELPLPTRVCLTLSTWFREDWMIMIGVMAILVAVYLLAVRTAKGRYWRDRFLLGMPMIGPLLVKAALSRFASVFSILQASGVGILDSIQILAGTIGNSAIGKEVENVQARLEQGQGIARPLLSARYFTPMFVNMVAIGEESGKLDEMLREVSSHYDAEVEYATRRLTTAMGPILIVALAALVGFFALAVYMPMWDLAKIVTKAG